MPDQDAHCAGFFADKAADDKARGEAPRKKRTKEEQFSDFMASVSSDVREVEAREEAEATAAAQERTERDVFEQRCAPASKGHPQRLGCAARWRSYGEALLGGRGLHACRACNFKGQLGASWLS